jgi:DNA-binding NtrC family response regulator
MVSVYQARLLSEDLPQKVRTCLDSEDSERGESGLYDREFDAFQKSLFERIIKEAGGNRAEAARRFGFHPTWFRRRCRELNL